MSEDMNEDQVKFALETWKTAISVQQHFNTIEMQIRNIAITVLTATIGAAGLVFNQTQQTIQVAIKANQPIPPLYTTQILGINVSAAKIIIFAGLLAWVAFYFMDRWWYHRLLQGSVKQAQFIEDKIKKTSYGELMSLSNAIKKESPFKFLGIKQLQIHSDNKIDIFYGIVFILLISMILFVF